MTVVFCYIVTRHVARIVSLGAPGSFSVGGQTYFEYTILLLAMSSVSVTEYTNIVDNTSEVTTLWRYINQFIISFFIIK